MELDFDFDYNTRPMGFWAFVVPFALASMVIGILVYMFTGFLNVNMIWSLPFNKQAPFNNNYAKTANTMLVL